jgi:superfamily I DNA and/or RNA helicase
MKTNSEEGAEKAEGTYRGFILGQNIEQEDYVVKVEHLKHSRIRISCLSTPAYFEPTEMQIEMAGETITGSGQNPICNIWYQIPSKQMMYNTEVLKFMGGRQ